jgi:hypothetical protein
MVSLVKGVEGLSFEKGSADHPLTHPSSFHHSHLFRLGVQKHDAALAEAGVDVFDDGVDGFGLRVGKKS